MSFSPETKDPAAAKEEEYFNQLEVVYHLEDLIMVSSKRLRLRIKV